MSISWAGALSGATTVTLTGFSPKLITTSFLSDVSTSRGTLTIGNTVVGVMAPGSSNSVVNKGGANTVIIQPNDTNSSYALLINDPNQAL